MENTTQSIEGFVLPSTKGQSRSISYHPRPLLNPDEVLRLRGPVKRGSDIVEAGDMIVMVTGFAPIYGRQILYFKNPVFLERARMAPPEHFEPLRQQKDYTKALGHEGVLRARAPDQPSALDDGDFTDVPTLQATVVPEEAVPQKPASSLEALEAENVDEDSGDHVLDPDAQDAKDAMEKLAVLHQKALHGLPPEMIGASDRKSTRLNSSH